jgi:hypothetical protein
MGSGESRSPLSSHGFSLSFLFRTMVSRRHPAPALPRRFGGADADEHARRERKTSSVLLAGRRSSSFRRPLASPNGQLLVPHAGCSPPLAGGWAPAPAGRSPLRWAAGHLTPAPTGRSPLAEQLLMQVSTWMIRSALPCSAAILACLLCTAVLLVC